MFSALTALLFALSTSTPPKDLEKAFVKAQIEVKGMEFGLSEERIEFIQKVVKCESNYQKYALGDKGKAFSYFQFWKGTFNSFKKEWGHVWLSYDNPDDHIELGMWAFATGRLDSHWACSKMVK